MTNHLKKVSKYRPSVLQGTLQFEVGRPRVGLAMEHPFERHALSILSLIFVVLIAGYLYFVASSIVNVMARSDAMAHIRDIEGNIGSLEQQYLALSENVSPERATLLGLAPVSHTVYVYRPGHSASVSATSNEI